MPVADNERENSRFVWQRIYIYINIITGTAPQYLSELVCISGLSRSVRSSSYDRTFRVPTFKRKQHGGRAFCFYAAQTWNSLPFIIHHSPSLPALNLKFKTDLKTHLLKKNSSFQIIFWLVIDQFSVLLIVVWVCVCVFSGLGWMGMLLMSLDLISVYS